MKRIFSGIQPSGDPHIGNYSGGFRQYAQTQEQGEAVFCIVDLHAITLQHDPAALRDGTYDIAAMLFATGIDPERSGSRPVAKRIAARSSEVFRSSAGS